MIAMTSLDEEPEHWQVIERDGTQKKMKKGQKEYLNAIFELLEESREEYLKRFKKSQKKKEKN